MHYWNRVKCSVEVVLVNRMVSGVILCYNLLFEVILFVAERFCFVLTGGETHLIKCMPLVWGMTNLCVMLNI